LRKFHGKSHYDFLIVVKLSFSTNFDETGSVDVKLNFLPSSNYMWYTQNVALYQSIYMVVDVIKALPPDPAG